MCSSFNRYHLPLAYWFPEDHTSQFREKDTVLDGELNWLKRSNNRFNHFVLWLHTTFAVRRRGGDRPDESTATPLDFPAPQIKILNQVLIEDLIHNYLINDLRSPSYDDFMSPLEDFVILQRLMRAALNGQLGNGFPLEKLIDLERHTREYVPRQPTIQWEPNWKKKKSVTEFYKVLREAGDDVYETFIDSHNDMKERLENKPRCAAASL